MGNHKSISPHLIVFLIVCSFLLPACAFPTEPINAKLIERENACIALGSCPSAETPSPAPDKSTSTSSHPTSTTTTPSQTDTTLPPGPTESVTVDTKPNPIKKGYVAFGDSVAAGFGTGTTTGDACRQGEFSYPKQLASSAPVGIDFQNLACSGAVITEVLSGGTGSQIDMWTNPANADIATLSIGGNDVGFSKILDACIVQSMGGAGQLFYDCQARIQDATATITGNDLYQNIFQALSQIVTKSGRTDFKIYFTGYPAFFNVDTTCCNDVTFFYWAPHHRPAPINDGYPYLSQQLRLQLNNLLMSLNRFLSGLVNDFNTQQQFQNNSPVVFVPTDPTFNGHRFCEQGVQEPDSSHSDTWFFLSGWPDNNLPGSAATASSLDAVIQGNTTALPDPNTCDPYGNDPEAALQCRTAKAITVAGSQEVEIFDADMQAVAQGNFSTVDIPWWMPTRQAKTFHPKTLGHLAYKNTIMNYF